MPHDRLADNDSGKPDDHGAAPHIDVGIPLILAKQSSGQRDQTVGQRQTDNLIDAGIDALRSAHSRIATGRPDAATQFGSEKQVQHADNCRRCDPQQEQRRRNVHLGKQHRIRPRRNCLIRLTKNLQIDRPQSHLSQNACQNSRNTQSDVQRPRDTPGDQPDQKSTQQRQPRVDVPHDQNRAYGGTGAYGTVHCKVCDIQNPICDIDADCHDTPYQTLRNGTGK